MAAPQKPPSQALAVAGPRLPYVPEVQERFGVNRSDWKALVEAVFPAAETSGAVVLALAYCKARGLDPFKKPVHIVPIWDKKKKCMVEGLWPGVGEHRTTATRTGEYAGKDPTAWGPMAAFSFNTDNGPLTINTPEWAQVTVYRMIAGQRIAFAGPTVWWVEAYSRASKNDPSPNEQWRRRPRGQLEKCAEAAALRAAFPEERPAAQPAIEAYWSQPAPASVPALPAAQPPRLDTTAMNTPHPPATAEPAAEADWEPATEHQPEPEAEPETEPAPAGPPMTSEEAAAIILATYAADFEGADSLGRVAELEQEAAGSPDIMGSPSAMRSIVSLGLQARARIKAGRGEATNPQPEPTP